MGGNQERESEWLPDPSGKVSTKGLSKSHQSPPFALISAESLQVHLSLLCPLTQVTFPSLIFDHLHIYGNQGANRTRSHVYVGREGEAMKV